MPANNSLPWELFIWPLPMRIQLDIEWLRYRKDYASSMNWSGERAFNNSSPTVPPRYLEMGLRYPPWHRQNDRGRPTSDG